MSGTLPEPLSFCPNDDVPQHPGSTTPAHSACRFTNLCCNGPSARPQPVPRPRFLCRFTGISRSPFIHISTGQITPAPAPLPPLPPPALSGYSAEASTSFRVDFSVRHLVGLRTCGTCDACRPLRGSRAQKRNTVYPFRTGRARTGRLPIDIICGASFRVFGRTTAQRNSGIGVWPTGPLRVWFAATGALDVGLPTSGARGHEQFRRAALATGVLDISPRLDWRSRDVGG